MKLKFSFAILLFCLLPIKADATEISLLDNGVVRCGTNLSTDTFAYREDDMWKGYDADICRAFAWAMYGNGKKIQMVNVKSHEIENALVSGKIDVMLSNNVSMAAMEAKQRASAVGLLYYDRQMFAAKEAPKDITSMKDFTGKKVCVFAGADYLDNLKSYNKEYKLGFRIMAFKSLRKARNAFLLKRCDLLTFQGLSLQSIIKEIGRAHV